MVDTPLVTEEGRVARNRTTFVSGWVLAVAVPAFVIGVADPLAAWKVPTDDAGWNVFMLSVTGAAAAGSLLAHGVFARPVVVLGETHVMVRNPMMVHVFPRKIVTEAERGWWYPRIGEGGRTIRLMALEESLWQFTQGAPAQEGAIAELNPDTSSASHVGRHTLTAAPMDERVRSRKIRAESSGLQSRMAPVDRIAVVLVAVWLTYILAGCLNR